MPKFFSWFVTTNSLNLKTTAFKHLPDFSGVFECSALAKQNFVIWPDFKLQFQVETQKQYSFFSGFAPFITLSAGMDP